MLCNKENEDVSKFICILLVRILFPQFEVLVEKNPETPRNF